MFSSWHLCSVINYYMLDVPPKIKPAFPAQPYEMSHSQLLSNTLICFETQVSHQQWCVSSRNNQAWSLHTQLVWAPSGWLSQHEPVSRKYAGCWNDPGTSPLINCLKLQRWNGQSTLWATAQTPATCLVLQKWNQPYWQSNVCRFECKEEKRSGKKTKYLLIVLRFGHVSVQI